MTRLFLSPPHLSGSEQAYVAEAFASNYIAPLGPMVEAFEHAFADYTGIPHCLALNSGTAAIHLALRGLGVGAGDVVLASTLTFIGSVAPILYQGATPVFIDADPETWNMDLTLLEATLAVYAASGTPVKAILPTDLYGQAMAMDGLRAIADTYQVPVVMDAAESVGSQYRGAHAGVGAAAAAFSFNGNKIITTSGGGMLASHNKAFIDEARFLSQQARDPAPHYEHHTYGYNYRMSNIVAAIGRGQLEALPQRVAKKREIFAAYQAALGELPGIRFMPEAAGVIGNRWLSVIRVDAATFGADRETIRQALEAADIESRPVWKPMHLQPAFAGAEMVGGAVSEALFREGLCLPSGTAMTDADLARVCDIVRGCARA